MVSQPSRREQIAALERQLADLRDQQRADLVLAIVLIIGAGVAFSAAEVWAHQAVHVELAEALEDAGIRSPRQLGKKLRSLGLERVGADHDGAIWIVR